MQVRTGCPAPDFSLPNQHGEPVTLSSQRGRPVLAVFYPFAFSRVCTGELREVRDHLPELAGGDVELLAISCDPMFALRAFADAEGYTYPLLSDFWPHGEVARAYGVFDEQRGCAGRSTFLVDGAGIVRWQVSNDQPNARDLAEARRELARLTTA